MEILKYDLIVGFEDIMTAVKLTQIKYEKDKLIHNKKNNFRFSKPRNN